MVKMTVFSWKLYVGLFEQVHLGEIYLPIAEKLLDEESSDFLLADRGYDCDAFRKILQERGTEPVIPGKKNRLVKVEYDAHIYRERNFVERFFNRVKHFRRIATRYDKTSIMFMGSLILTGILMCLKL